ncbi:MAG: hemolysin III family protein [Planctomycetaceae bacterium]
MHDIHVLPGFGLREPFSVLSHLLGVGVFLVLAVRLVRRGEGNGIRRAGLAIMAYTSIQALLISSLYHAFWPGPMRDLLLRADVAGIFLMMAGCVTPVHLILFTGLWRWVPLMVAWGFALLGAWLKFSVYQGSPGFAGMVIFLVYGWAGAVTALEVWRRYGWTCIRKAVFGGLVYTAGAIVLMLHAPTLVDGVIGPHELWHLAVLCGLSFHWQFIFQIANRESPAASHRGLGIALPHRLLRPPVYLLYGLSANFANRRRRNGKSKAAEMSRPS